MRYNNGNHRNTVLHFIAEKNATLFQADTNHF